MAEKLVCELQDDKGNIFYLHTDASVVFCSNGQSVETKLNAKIDTSKTVNNLTTTNAGFILDARMGKSLKDSIDTLNTKWDVFCGIANSTDNGSYLYGKDDFRLLHLRFRNTTKYSVATAYTLITLGTGNRPKRETAVYSTDIDGNVFRISIGTNGVTVLTNQYVGEIKANSILHVSIPYFVSG